MTELNKIRQVSTCIPSISEFCSLCEEQYILKNLSDKLAAGRLANFLLHNANSECKQSLAKVPFVRNFHGLGKKCMHLLLVYVVKVIYIPSTIKIFLYSGPQNEFRVLQRTSIKDVRFFFEIFGDTYLPLSYTLCTIYLCTMSDFP